MSQKRKKPQQPDQNASDSPIENEVIDLSINQLVTLLFVTFIQAKSSKWMQTNLDGWNQKDFILDGFWIKTLDKLIYIIKFVHRYEFAQTISCVV